MACLAVLFEELRLGVASLFLPNCLMMKRIIKRVGEDGGSARERNQSDLKKRGR